MGGPRHGQLAQSVSVRQRPVHRWPSCARSATQPLAVDEFYAGFARRGLDFGEGFRALRKLHVGEKQALGEVELAADLARDAGTYRMHPVLLDGCLQVLAAALARRGRGVAVPADRLRPLRAARPTRDTLLQPRGRASRRRRIASRQHPRLR